MHVKDPSKFYAAQTQPKPMKIRDTDFFSECIFCHWGKERWRKSRLSFFKVHNPQQFNMLHSLCKASRVPRWKTSTHQATNFLQLGVLCFCILYCIILYLYFIFLWVSPQCKASCVCQGAKVALITVHLHNTSWEIQPPCDETYLWKRYIL